MYTFFNLCIILRISRIFLSTSNIRQSEHYFAFRNSPYIRHWLIRPLVYSSRIFLHSSLINQGIFCLSRISSIFSLIKGLLHFANISHSLFHWSGLFCISRISYIQLFIIQGLFLQFAKIIHPSFYYSGPIFAFRENHTFNLLLIRAFFDIPRFIHPFLSWRINFFSFWALI